MTQAWAAWEQAERAERAALRAWEAANRTERTAREVWGQAVKRANEAWASAEGITGTRPERRENENGSRNST